MKISVNDFPQTMLTRRQRSHKSGNWTTHEGNWVILDSDVQEYMPPYLYTQFLEEMSGQTMSNVGQESGYYLEDVDNFLKGRKVTD